MKSNGLPPSTNDITQEDICSSLGDSEGDEIKGLKNPEKAKLSIISRKDSAGKKEQIITKKIIEKIRSDILFPANQVDLTKGVFTKPKNFFSKKFIETSTNDERVFFSNKRIYLYKTEMCRSYNEMGYCKYGDRCQFSHNDVEMRDVSRHPKYKTESCRVFWERGTCPYGKRCCFMHSEIDLDKEDSVGIKQVVNQTLNLEMLIRKCAEDAADSLDDLRKSSVPYFNYPKANLIKKNQTFVEKDLSTKLETKSHQNLGNVPLSSNQPILMHILGIGMNEINSDDSFGMKESDDIEFNATSQAMPEKQEFSSKDFLDIFYRIDDLNKILEARDEFKELDYTNVNKPAPTMVLAPNFHIDTSIWKN